MDLDKKYPANSIIPEPKKEKEIKRVVSGTVRKRKAPVLDRIFGGETGRNIVEYILWDVLVPAAKSTISDIVTNSIEMALYGTTDSRSRSLRRDRDRTYVSYNRMSDPPRRRSSRYSRRDEPRRESRMRTTHRFDEIVLDRRSDAEEVLSVLIELIETYDIATVGDFYDALGMSSDYTDRRYGWESLDMASIRPVRGGYIFDMPKPYPIE